MSMFSSNKEKSKISSSKQHRVFSILFYTITEWLLYIKENIKLCI